MFGYLVEIFHKIWTRPPPKVESCFFAGGFIGHDEFPAISSLVSKEAISDVFLPKRNTPPVLALALRRNRGDLQSLPLFFDDGVTRSLTSWFFVFGLREFNLLRFVSPQVAAWLNEIIASGGVTRLMRMVAAHRPDCPQNGGALASWFRRYGVHEFGLNFETGEKPTVSASTLSEFPQPSQLARKRGVNLVGFARHQLGIGEDVRCMALALKNAGVPFTVISISPYNTSAAHDRSIEKAISNNPIYNTNIYCLTGFDTVRVFL